MTDQATRYALSFAGGFIDGWLMASRRFALPVAYVVVGFLTFGHVFNHGPCPGDATPKSCEATRLALAPMCGLVWPLYWAGRAAIRVTE